MRASKLITTYMERQLLWKFTLTYSNLQITVIHCSQLQERQYTTFKDKKVYYYFDLVGNVQHITIKKKEPITRKYFCDSYIFPVTYQHPVCQRLFICPRSISLRPTSKHPATHEQYCSGTHSLGSLCRLSKRLQQKAFTSPCWLKTILIPG